MGFVSFIANNEPGDAKIIDGIDQNLYQRQVASYPPWDSSGPFRQAVAVAKDRARVKLIQDIRSEARRLSMHANSDLSTYFSSNNTDPASFEAQANSNIQVQRSIDGVPGAPDDAILL